MNTSEKFKSDLERTLRNGKNSSDAEKLIYAALRGFPESLKEDLCSGYAEKFKGDKEKANNWIGGIISILTKDYDGTEFSKEEWAELREIVSDASEKMDIDTLSYVMTLVVDHKAI